jgi:hypothetical protein
LREECRLREFENKMLRGIFGAKRDKVTGEWRKLHNKELNDLYCSPNIVQVLEVMPTSVYTGLNLFNFTPKHFL